MMRREAKNPWVLLLLLLVGVVIGSFLGEFFSNNPYLGFLNFGKQFGISLDNPFLLNLGIIQLSFALMFNINIMSIIGIILAIVIFSKVG